MLPVFLRATAMLARLLVKLGKFSYASEILTPVVAEVRELALPSSSAVLVLLRFAELLSLNGDVSER